MSREVKDRKRLSDAFGIPSWFWTRSSEEASGFFHAQYVSQANGSNKLNMVSRFLIKHVGDSERDKHIGKHDLVGDSSDLVTANNIKNGSISYHWQRLSFVYSWQASDQPQLLCLLPANTLTEFADWWKTENIDMASSSPFILLAKSLEYVVASFDHAVWSWRDVVRHLEKRRLEVDNLQKDWVVRMHEIARHAIHSSEMLEMALHVVDSLLTEIDREKDLDNSRVHSTTGRSDQSGDIKRLKTMLQCIHLRSQALEKRIQNEMALVRNYLTDSTRP